jgi:hypothetical protein
MTGATKPKADGRRPRNSVPLASEMSKEAKRMAAVLLEVLAGLRTPLQAAEALQVSLPRYYQLEARGLHGLLDACEPRPKGRQADPGRAMALIQRENEQLRRDLSAQQSLVRVTQRSIGLTPPAAPPPKPSGKKTRKRKPVARALSMAARLRQEAEAMPSDNGLSAAAAAALDPGTAV